MQLHTDRLDSGDMYEAARIAGVSFLRIDEKGSRTRQRKFDFRLEGWTSHRYMNSGRFGAQTWDGNAATWDEWGIFLNVLFQRDPEAHCGKYSYWGLRHFQWATDNRFDTLARADQHPSHTWDGRLTTDHNARACRCGALVRYGIPEHLRIVKGGIVEPAKPETVERWLSAV